LHQIFITLIEAFVIGIGIAAEFRRSVLPARSLRREIFARS